MRNQDHFENHLPFGMRIQKDRSIQDRKVRVHQAVLDLLRFEYTDLKNSRVICVEKLLSL